MATAAARKTVPGKRASPKPQEKAKAAAAKSASAAKDPKGGLTAAGRAAFAAKDGSHLKPGVTKADDEMSPEDMKRKGSWAVRFYGRAALPPLVDAKGEPTRFALSAHAWGEPVPKTEAEARRIADKGRKLLERYAAASGKTPGEATAAPKTAGRKTAAKEPAAKKAAAKKAAAKKAAANAPAAKKASAKKATAKKAAAKKIAVKKTTSNKTASA